MLGGAGKSSWTASFLPASCCASCSACCLAAAAPVETQCMHACMHAGSATTSRSSMRAHPRPRTPGAAGQGLGAAADAPAEWTAPGGECRERGSAGGRFGEVSKAASSKAAATATEKMPQKSAAMQPACCSSQPPHCPARRRAHAVLLQAAVWTSDGGLNLDRAVWDPWTWR